VPYVVECLAHVEKYGGTIFFVFCGFVDFMNNSMALMEC
jgi:hypothetical protein